MLSEMVNEGKVHANIGIRQVLLTLNDNPTGREKSGLAAPRKAAVEGRCQDLRELAGVQAKSRNVGQNIARPLLMDLFGPAHIEQAVIARLNNYVSEVKRIEDASVADRDDTVMCHIEDLRRKDLLSPGVGRQALPLIPGRP